MTPHQMRGDDFKSGIIFGGPGSGLTLAWFLPSQDRTSEAWTSHVVAQTLVLKPTRSHRLNVPTPLTMSVWAADELATCTAKFNISSHTHTQECINVEK